MGRKQIEAFKQLVVDGLKSQPQGAGLLLNVFFADAAAMEIDDEEVRSALAELYEEGKAHPWSQPRKLWQTGLALGPKSPRKRKGKVEASDADAPESPESEDAPGSSDSPDSEDAS